jgi:AraC-like DNA-binding protein
MFSWLSVDLLSIFLFITLAQGVFVLSLLLFRYKLRPVQHLYLFFLILMLLWFQAEFLSVRLSYDIHIPAFYGTRYGAWLILGPLFYIYSRAVVGNPIVSLSAIVLHVAPFVVFTCIIPLLIYDVLSFRQVNYGMLTTFDPFNDSVSFMQYAYAIIFIAQFVQGLLYTLITYTLLRNYEVKLKANYSSLDISNLRWAKTLTILLILALVLVSLFLLLFFVTQSYNRNLDYLYVIPTSLLIYAISYKLAGVSWPSGADQVARATKYEKSSLKYDQAKAYAIQLERFMAETKPYLKNELRLQEFADMMKIPAHHVSQVINEHLNTTFFDYINKYRVDEAKRLILTEPKSSLLEIAFKAGFNNKTSFNNAFKKFTSQTPAAFRKKHRLS